MTRSVRPYASGKSRCMRLDESGDHGLLRERPWSQASMSSSRNGASWASRSAWASESGSPAAIHRPRRYASGTTTRYLLPLDNRKRARKRRSVQDSVRLMSTV